MPPPEWLTDGGFVLPNRLVIPIVWGTWLEFCYRLPFLLADVVEAETAENSTDETPNHIHAE